MSIFIDLKRYYKKALNEDFAIGAFNTSDLEITQAIAEAASEMKAPVIIQTTPGAIEYAGLEQIFDIIKNEIENNKIFATIHLDHGKDFGIAKAAINIGYQSVMIDGSYLDFNENVALTRRVVGIAKDNNVRVEAEIGRISKEEGGKLSHKGAKTDPDEALDFVKKTSVDALAVSVGNEHGAPKGEKLDLELIEKISKKVNLPLVIHGSSGLSRHDIREAIKRGVVKFNIDTNIRKIYSKKIKSADKDETDPREILGEAKKAVKKLVKDYIKIFGSAGKEKL